MARITAPACLVRKAAIALVVVVLMLSPAVEAYIYHLPNRELGVVDSTGESTYQYLSEGPMFSRDDAPFGDGLSYIDISGTAALDASGAVLGSAVLNVIFFSEYNEETVGYYSGLNGGNTLQNRELCCTRQHVLRGVCNHAGRVIVQGLNTNFTVPGFSGPLPLLHAYFVHGGEVTFHDKYVVQRSGSQSAMLVVCDSDFTLTAKVTANIVAEFHNPYGYVRGIQYGYLPGYGALTCAYAVRSPAFVVCAPVLAPSLTPCRRGPDCVLWLLPAVPVPSGQAHSAPVWSGVCDVDGNGGSGNMVHHIHFKERQWGAGVRHGWVVPTPEQRRHGSCCAVCGEEHCQPCSVAGGLPGLRRCEATTASEANGLGDRPQVRTGRGYTSRHLRNVDALLRVLFVRAPQRLVLCLRDRGCHGSCAQSRGGTSFFLGNARGCVRYDLRMLDLHGSGKHSQATAPGSPTCTCECS